MREGEGEVGSERESEREGGREEERVREVHIEVRFSCEAFTSTDSKLAGPR